MKEEWPTYEIPYWVCQSDEGMINVEMEHEREEIRLEGVCQKELIVGTDTLVMLIM